MLVWLAELLTPHFTFFNVFSYLTFRAILSIITGLPPKISSHLPRVAALPRLL